MNAQMMYIAIGLLFLTGCGDSKPRNIQGADFPTMKTCLLSIEKNSGKTLNIITDKPDNVSGNLSNGNFFMCLKKTSGTKGTYYEGSYNAG